MQILVLFLLNLQEKSISLLRILSRITVLAFLFLYLSESNSSNFFSLVSHESEVKIIH